MSWQQLIWNVFIWTFTGIMIYVTKSSLWWLLIPAMLTVTQNAADIVRAAKDDEVDSSEIDEETLDQMKKLKEKVKRGDYRREWV